MKSKAAEIFSDRERNVISGITPGEKFALARRLARQALALYAECAPLKAAVPPVSCVEYSDGALLDLALGATPDDPLQLARMWERRARELRDGELRRKLFASGPSLN